MRSIFDGLISNHVNGFKSVSLIISLFISGVGQTVIAEPITVGKSLSATNAPMIQGQIVFSHRGPVANAAIYVADLQLDSLFESKRHGRGVLPQPINNPKSSTFSYSPATTTCERPKVAVLSFTCSDENGNFSLALPNLPALPVVISVSKDSMTASVSLGLDDLGGDIGQIALDTALMEDNLDRIAIVDKFSSFVKSGMSANEQSAQESSELMMNSEFLTAYGLDILQSNVEYPGFDTLFNDSDNDGRLDIYNYATVLLKTSWKSGLSQIDATKKQVLLDYVEKGGQLLINNKPQHKINNIEGYI